MQIVTKLYQEFIKSILTEIQHFWCCQDNTIKASTFLDLPCGPSAKVETYQCINKIRGN